MRVDLLRRSTRAPKGMDKNATKKETAALIEEMNELQNVMYAEGKHSLLIVLQGMDASGKDGTTRAVFSAVNPMGVRVQSFKVPTEEERSHDFIWRVHKVAPAKGMIQIFNRSHYEDVLVTRMLGLVDDKTAKEKFVHINNFEKLLQHNGTIVLKFYLHISEEEQAERFKERLEMEHKHWKYNPKDLDHAKKWPEFRKYYQDVFKNCGPDIPWYIVPADQNWYKKHFVAKTVVEKLRSLNMKYPGLKE